MAFIPVLWRQMRWISELEASLLYISSSTATPTVSTARSTAMESSFTKFRWLSSTKMTSSLWICHWPHLQVEPPLVCPESSTRRVREKHRLLIGMGLIIPTDPPCHLLSRRSPAEVQGTGHGPQP